MPRYVTITDVSRHFSEYVGRVRFAGERFVLTKGGKPVAELGPAAAGPVTLRDLLARLAAAPALGPDEAEAFARDVAAGRRALAPPLEEDPWTSS